MKTKRKHFSTRDVGLGNLWAHLKSVIVRILIACVDLGHHPKQWRSAKMVVLRMPGKPDYSVPGAYSPIWLLKTLGKVLEAMTAQQLSEVAEKHGLLPKSQFGGRPGTTTGPQCKLY